MSKNPTNGTSVAEQVRKILMKRPFLMNAIKKGIVNYSALARLIKDEIKEGSIEAIKAAVIRQREEIGEKVGHQEERIMELLKNTKIKLQDKIATLISKGELDIPYIVSSHLTDRHIYIVDQTKVNLESFEDIEVNRNLVALVLTSPKEIERIPGVVAFISQLLSSHNVNIREFISSYTDTVIVLNQEDALKAFSLLQKYI